jgi:hypothetical protein
MRSTDYISLADLDEAAKMAKEVRRISIRVIDDQECLVVLVETREGGMTRDSIDFDYEFPSQRCRGSAFERAMEAARSLAFDFKEGGFEVEIVEI